MSAVIRSRTLGVITRGTPFRTIRLSSTATGSYSRRTPQPPSEETLALLQTYENLSPQPVPLRTVLSFGEQLSPDSVVASAHFTLTEIPKRLAQRVRSLDCLPFIVGTNPFIARIHELYQRSFSALASYPAPTNIEENRAFTLRLESLVDAHADDIPVLAKGFRECARYMTPAVTTLFLDEIIRSRIAVRLIAEQHIAISHALETPQEQGSTSRELGIVNKKTSPKDMVTMCSRFVSELSDATLGASPRLVLEGDVDATFPYVPVHLEYILTEVLKNSYRATVEHHHDDPGPLPPVVVTIASSMLPPSPQRPAYMSIRIRDQGGGVSPAHMKNIFSYAFTTADSKGALSPTGDDGLDGGPYAAQHVGGIAAIGDQSGAGSLFGEITGKGLQTGLGSIAGLGYGLPLARLYASYFGGGSGLELVPLYRFGTDVFIKLRALDMQGGDEVMI
ncbi:26S proteasome regulatory subunit 7 [Tulasnella sp. 427]|nr:26S proteasome regulatory subunit 7 [Tulasnella sp. 427]